MSADPVVKQMPSFKPGSGYDQGNERRHRALVSDELGNKHDRRSDLRVGAGKSLVLSSPGNVDWVFGFDDTGKLTVTNYETGAVGTLVIDWAAVDGLDVDALEAGIVTAQSTADGAETNAQTGISDAADAILDAADAQTTGDSALASASTANTAAGNAQTAADIIVSQAGQLFPNWNFKAIDADGKPAGINYGANTSNRDQVEASSTGLKITSSPDSNVAYGFPAIPIDDALTYKLTIRHKSSASSATGLYLRWEETDSALTDGKTHVSSGSLDHAVARTSQKSHVSNGAMPGTTLVEDTYTYAPTAGTRFASFFMYNWTAFSGDYEAESVSLSQISPNAPPTASASTSLITKLQSGAGASTSGSVTVTADEGSGGYSYQWSIVSGDDIDINSDTSATTTFSTTLSLGEATDTRVRCDVVDSDGRSAVAFSRVQFTETS